MYLKTYNEMCLESYKFGFLDLRSFSLRFFGPFDSAFVSFCITPCVHFMCKDGWIQHLIINGSMVECTIEDLRGCKKDDNQIKKLKHHLGRRFNTKWWSHYI